MKQLNNFDITCNICSYCVYYTPNTQASVNYS